jgi:hypothetical protein
MFERLNTPQEAYDFKLGAALPIERKVLEILDANIDEARPEQVATLFRRHRRATAVKRLREQVAAVTPKRPAEGGGVADEINSALT